MKKRFLALLVLISLGYSTSLVAQCNPDRHSTTWFDQWFSCEVSENPNPLRGESHWINYTFETVYKLGELKLWNINAPDLLEYGAMTIMVDYSLDGEEWTEYGEISLAMATGKNDYEGENVLDFGDIKAKYLLFTITENFGGDCYGFSEMRLAAEPIAADDPEVEDVCVIADIYPNPTVDNFTIFVEKACLGDVYMTLEDATGRTVLPEEIVPLFENRIIPTENLMSGVYFVVLRNGEITKRYKVVKD